MSMFKFRPQLESMDPRIVPDAAPIAAPGPDQTTASSSFTGIDDAELGAMIAQLEQSIVAINAQLNILQQSINNAVARVNGAQLALNAALAGGNPITIASARGELKGAQDSVDDLVKQYNVLGEDLERIEGRLEFLQNEQMRRQQGPQPPRDPIAVTGLRVTR